jgi:MinD superfamily P-loop ATPase
MILAIASGKGGTGKTTLAVNLAVMIGSGVRLLDCDVEEPNCHIFLRAVVTARQSAYIPIPVIDRDKCTACGRCAEVCQFKAIAAMKSKPLVFEELCHGCGGCMRICPSGAISEKPREIGMLEFGQAGEIEWVQGCLNVGEALAPPLIREVKKQIRPGELTIIDCPPGTSCPVIAAMRGADFVMLVTEPTPFGLHDLKLAVETVRQLGLPFGVVINRANSGDRRVVDYCTGEAIEILAQIPESRQFAEAYSAGTLICEISSEFRVMLRGLVAGLHQRGWAAAS